MLRGLFFIHLSQEESWVSECFDWVLFGAQFLLLVSQGVLKLNFDLVWMNGVFWVALIIVVSWILVQILDWIIYEILRNSLIALWPIQALIGLLMRIILSQLPQVIIRRLRPLIHWALSWAILKELLDSNLIHWVSLLERDIWVVTLGVLYVQLNIF